MLRVGREEANVLEARRAFEHTFDAHVRSFFHLHCDMLASAASFAGVRPHKIREKDPSERMPTSSTRKLKLVF